jgi:hypothetical protein
VTEPAPGERIARLPVGVVIRRQPGARERARIREEGDVYRAPAAGRRLLQ